MRRSRRYAYDPRRTITNEPSLEELNVLCSQRFASPEYEVRRDEGSGTVWVSQEGGQLSIGIRPNVIERRGLEAVMADAGEKLSRES